jgi:hypothetical protein
MAGFWFFPLKETANANSSSVSESVNCADLATYNAGKNARYFVPRYTKNLVKNNV